MTNDSLIELAEIIMEATKSYSPGTIHYIDNASGQGQIKTETINALGKAYQAAKEIKEQCDHPPNQSYQSEITRLRGAMLEATEVIERALLIHTEDAMGEGNTTGLKPVPDQNAPSPTLSEIIGRLGTLRAKDEYAALGKAGYVLAVRDCINEVRQCGEGKTEQPADDVYGIAHAICPHIKPWLDDDSIEPHACNRCMPIRDDDGENLHPMCLMEAKTIAKAAIAAMPSTYGRVPDTESPEGEPCQFGRNLGSAPPTPAPHAIDEDALRQTAIDKAFLAVDDAVGAKKLTMSDSLFPATVKGVRAAFDVLLPYLTAPHAANRLRDALRNIVEFCDDPDGSEKPETLAMGLARLLPAAREALEAIPEQAAMESRQDEPVKSGGRCDGGESPPLSDLRCEISVLKPQDDGLLPCPFCGGCGELDMHPTTPNGTIKCADCHARAHKVDWNKRATEPVSVDPDRAAQVISQYVRPEYMAGWSYRDVAKACAEAWGLKCK